MNLPINGILLLIYDITNGGKWKQKKINEYSGISGYLLEVENKKLSSNTPDWDENRNKQTLISAMHQILRRGQGEVEDYIIEVETVCLHGALFLQNIYGGESSP